MVWVTRSNIRGNRAATGWLIRRFVHAGARFSFVDPADLARIQVDDRAIGFDAPGATYPHQDGAGRCSFEALGDGEETLERSRFLCDALYASIRDRLGT